ncbi:phosphatase [Erysipelotrichaceae bacterium]|nr:phosphatase [Erysipelotrichaceae bacterium]
MNMKKVVVTFFVGFLVLTLGLSSCAQGAQAKTGEVVFYLTRHGKTMLNTTDRVQGWSDAVLTREGIEVVEFLGKGLKETPFVAAYSSDSGRSVQTAHIALKESGQEKIKLITDERFREFNFGMYEGDLNHTMWEDIATSEGKTLDEWMETFTPQSFADGVAALDKTKNDGKNWPAEDYATISERLKLGMEDVAEEVSKNGGGNVLLVSHGLSISAIVDVLSNGEKDGTRLKNASVTKIIYKDGVWEFFEIGSLDYVENGKIV